jgi:DNA polymerase-3 subunit gamma/tau
MSVREALLSTLSSGKVSHAYLFVGPRGAGKTSTARILAQAVNCLQNVGKDSLLGEPCGECVSCKVISGGASVDVIEIDAASNGLVDDIRDLREKVRLAPTQLSKKVYIIDEVHMVSTAVFNALLKTLEEPPAHALFILCTTESQKVPETIVSRCAKINFTKGTVDEVIGSLLKATRGENLEVDEMALREIALATDGSFREGHKLLEQLSAYGKKITEDLVADVLGIFGRGSVTKLLDAVVRKDGSSVMKSFAEMEKAGTKANILVVSLLNCARVELEKSFVTGENINVFVKIIDCLITASDRIRMSPMPLLPVEIALLSVCTEGEKDPDRPKALEPARPLPEKKVEDVIRTEARADIVPDVPKVMVVAEDSVVSGESRLAPTSKISSGLPPSQQEYPLGGQAYEIRNDGEEMTTFDKVKTEWGEFLNKMALSNGSLAGMLRQSAPIDLKGKSITISVMSRFQLEMLEREVKKKIIEEQMAKIWGPITFKCVLSDGPIRTEPISEDANIGPVTVEVAPKAVISVAEEIFGF